MLTYTMEECCKILKFSQNIVSNSRTVEADTHEEYLLQILRMEVQHRNEARKERLIKNAGFYTRKHFDTFRFDEVILPTSVDKDYLKECRFIDEKRIWCSLETRVVARVILPRPLEWKPVSRTGVSSFFAQLRW